MGDSPRERFLKIKGVTTIDKFDSELTIGSVVGIKKDCGILRPRVQTPARRSAWSCTAIRR